MKKIGALIPVWNQEKFIVQHIKMLSGKIDKIVILLQDKPFKDYNNEHLYGIEKDNTEQLLKQFDNIEIYPVKSRENFCADVFNDGLHYVKDCDMIFKLDPDCFFTEKDLNKWITHIHENNYDCYQIECSINSINYYITDRFDVGVRDGEENEVYAFNPIEGLHGVTSYNAKNRCFINETIDSYWKGFTMHHFKGWKKSCPDDFDKISLKYDIHSNFVKAYNNSGGFLTAPDEIINILKNK